MEISMKSTYMKGGSHDLVVIGDNSSSRGCGFESWRHLLDGYFSHWFVVKNVKMKRPKINEIEAGNGTFKKREIWFLTMETCRKRDHIQCWLLDCVLGRRGRLRPRSGTFPASAQAFVWKFKWSPLLKVCKSSGTWRQFISKTFSVTNCCRLNYFYGLKSTLIRSKESRI